MYRKTNTTKLFKSLVCCTFSFLALAPVLAFSPIDNESVCPSPTNFQTAIEKLHHDLLLSDCHSTNPTIHKCLDLLADRNATSAERCDAASQLGALKYMAQSSLVSLVRIYSSETDYSVKSSVALALVRISPSVAVLQLLPGIESVDEDYKQLCIAALASGNQEVVPPLIKALKCPDPNIRRQSAKALSELGATAITAVNVLKEISSDIDEKSLFAEQAARSAITIQKDYDEKRGPDVAFNADNWKDENGRHYRFRMVRDLIDSHVLIGLHTAQLHDMLGRGVSFFKATQWRYALGHRGGTHATRVASSITSKTAEHLSARVSYEEEQFLVVSTVDDLVTNCQIVAYDPGLWDVTNLDCAALQNKRNKESSKPRERSGTSFGFLKQKPMQLSVLAIASEQFHR